MDCFLGKMNHTRIDEKYNITMTIICTYLPWKCTEELDYDVTNGKKLTVSKELLLCFISQDIWVTMPWLYESLENPGQLCLSLFKVQRHNLKFPIIKTFTSTRIFNIIMHMHRIWAKLIVCICKHWKPTKLALKSELKANSMFLIRYHHWLIIGW